MKRNLIEIFRCPCCQEALALDAHVEEVGEVREGALSCPRGRVYPVVGGIPRVYKGALHDFPGVIRNENVTWAGEGRLPSRVRNTQKSYSNWWTRLRNERIYAWNNRAILLNRTMLSPIDFAGKRILDAGTGNGRFLKHLCDLGAREVVALDLSRGIEKARDLNSSLDRCHFVQANLLEVPLARESFDGVISIGVLHHTPNPRSAFQRVASLVRPGGFLSVFLYYQRWRPYDRRAFEFLRDFKWLCFTEPIRLMVTRMPHPIIVAFCTGLYVKRLLINSFRKNRLTRWMGAVVEQVTPPDGYLPGEGLRANIAWNYDGYSARYVYQISLEELLLWFQQAGYNDLTISPYPLSVTGWLRGKDESQELRVRIYERKPIDEIETLSSFLPTAGER